jgi:type III secretion protein R
MGADSQISIVQILIVSIGLGLLPFLAVSATSFTKISIVLFLVRNAMGLQQVPSNLVIQAIALTLTMFITAPLIEQVYTVVTEPGIRFQTPADIATTTAKVKKPVVEYLQKYTKEADREFFVKTTSRLWPDSYRYKMTNNDIAILVPSFLIAELKRAFEIGFLLYLPFMVVDMVVTTILIAMGLSQISPQIITVPFKVFLFISIDGWTRLLHGLVLSYV